MSNNNKYEDHSVLVREILFREFFTSEELEEIEEEEQNLSGMWDAEMRMVFDIKTETIDMGKRRTTDLKGNSQVILPKKMMR